MKQLCLRVLLATCLLSFLCCHLSWAPGQGGYFWQLGLEILAGGLRKDLLHPALLLPFCGQLLLLVSIFVPKIPKKTAIAGILLCGALVLLLLFIKIFSRETSGAGAVAVYLIAALMIIIRSRYFWPRESSSEQMSNKRKQAGF